MTLARRFRRWKKRMMRRQPWLRKAFPVIEGALGFLTVLGVAGALVVALWPRPEAAKPAPDVQVMAPPAATAEATEEPAATPEPTEAPVLIDGLPEEYYFQSASPASGVEPSLLISSQVRADAPAEPVHFGASAEFTALEGVTTFRGSNYRDGGAYGTIPENPSSMSIIWENKIGSCAGWRGVGWTGQPSIVRWPAELRKQMNIVPEKKSVEGLTEVMYATLDGNIYFLDLADGQPTRKSIDIGAPIKGSLSVDPRGLPLLYCGQGIYNINGRRVKCGTRVWSLIDQSLLYLLDGEDSYADREWRAFDSSPLIDPETGTMFTAGENGVVYSVDLNAQFSGSSVTVDPKVTRYKYKQTIEGKIGSENSVAAYNNYLYFATNTGIIQCIDANTMEPVWCFYTKDDIDATMVIDVESDGFVALYATNEQDVRGSKGCCQMYKFNALTGEVVWVRDSDTISQRDENGGGSFATPAVGKNGLENLVYFHVARTAETRGMVYALDKATGETVWSYAMNDYGWSSPTCVYTPSGRGYVLVGSSNGIIRLFDGLTGAVVAAADLETNIEASPAVFGDTLVVGTRGSRIFGIRIG